MVIVSGMRSTGKLHLGHLMTIENWLQFQNDNNKSYYFIANWHALTTHKEDIDIIRESVYDTVKHYIAAGIDPDKSTIFVQSDIKEHAELYLLFSMLISVPRLERIPTYKSQQENITDKDLSTAGFLTYPILQTADVLMYKANAVPVGEDQVYHIEVSREIARKFNSLYGEIFPEPESIVSRIPALPGTDGRKMSKSYGNSIYINITPDELSKMIMPMMTDPARKRRTDAGNPEVCPVWEYHKAFTHSEDEKNWVIGGCKSAGIGCIECKKVLFKNMSEKLTPVWERLGKISDTDVKNVIEEGNKKAREVARQTMAEVNKAMKFDY